MRKILLVLLCAMLPFAANAQKMNHSKKNHSAFTHDMPMENDALNKTKNIKFNKNISAYERDEHGQPTLNFGAIPMHDNAVFYVFQANRFEKHFQNGDDVTLWDITGWVGNDYNKLYLKSEGNYNISKNEHESTRAELLYSHNLSTFWDVQAGLRHDFIANADDRNFATLSLYGLAPYWFEIDASAYLSDEGDISARIEGEFDLLLTQRLILQPRFETALALQDVPKYNIGSGINDIELGMRLRYEFNRKFSPYIGIEWTEAIGDTKNLIKTSGEDPNNTAIVTGVKFWF